MREGSEQHFAGRFVRLEVRLRLVLMLPEAGAAADGKQDDPEQDGSKSHGNPAFIRPMRMRFHTGTRLRGQADRIVHAVVASYEKNMFVADSTDKSTCHNVKIVLR